MISLILFGISGVSYFKYRSKVSEYKILTSVEDDESNTQYTTGYLEPGPLKHNGNCILSLKTSVYSVHQRLVKYNDSTYTETLERFSHEEPQINTVSLNDIDVSNLVPRMHALFAVKLGERFEAQGPVDLYHRSIQLGWIRWNSRNESFVGSRYVYYGVKYNPHTMYTVVGPFNRGSFDPDTTLIYENKTLEEARIETNTSMHFWRRFTMACVIGGLVLIPICGLLK